MSSIKKLVFVLSFSFFSYSSSAFALDGYAQIKENIMHRTDAYAVKMQKQIAFNYESGENGFPLDKKSALKWYLIAFNNGDSYSGYKYAVISKDIGNINDFLSFSEKSISQNNKNACFYLSNYYIDEYKKDLFLNKKYIYLARDTLSKCGGTDQEAVKKMIEIKKEIDIIEKK